MGALQSFCSPGASTHGLPDAIFFLERRYGERAMPKYIDKEFFLAVSLRRLCEIR